MTTAALSEPHSDLAYALTSDRPAVKAIPTLNPVRCNVLGVGISAVNLDLATKVIDGWIESRPTALTFASPGCMA